MMFCSRHPQTVSPYQSTVKKSRCGGKNVWKKVEMGEQGEHPKMPDPQFVKTYHQTTMMPKVPQSMGFYYNRAPK